MIEAMITDLENTDKAEAHEQADEATGIPNKWNCWNLLVILNAENQYIKQ